MNINIFFLIITSFLFIILFTFKPLDIKQQDFVDVPLFNISYFTMYELDNYGLVTQMNGTNGIRYEDRYTVKDIDYTDNSKEYIANMKADNGIYKGDVVNLDGNVVYFREDGLTFETQHAVYNKKTSISRADGDYVLYQGDNIAVGKKLTYNNLSEKITSKHVTMKYQLKERNK